MCEDCKGKKIHLVYQKGITANTQISDIRKVTERGKKGPIKFYILGLIKSPSEILPNETSIFG